MTRKDEGYRYEAGDTSMRWESKDDLRKVAMETYKDHFPGAKVLIEGQRSCADPQRVLVGPSIGTIIELNGYFMDCEELDWWEGSDEEQAAVEDFCDLWQEVLDRYLKE